MLRRVASRGSERELIESTDLTSLPPKPPPIHTTNYSNSTKGSLQLPLKKQFTSDSDGEGTKADNPRAPSPSAALRAAKQQAGSASTGGERKQSTTGGLNRSSTKKLLNLIKTKTRTDLTLPDGDENDEIEALLGALETESIDNIDWDELGLDENEVKDIIKRGEELSSDDSSDESSGSGEEEEVEEEEEEVEKSTVHYVIRTK